MHTSGNKISLALTGVLALSMLLLADGSSSLTITRVSLHSNGAQGNNFSDNPSISAGGRYVAFESLADNLVNGDTNERWDIFFHDRQTAQTTRLSLSSGGAQANENSYWASVSDDGRYVAFQSAATNLVSGDTNGTDDIFLRDRQTAQTTRISVASGGAQGDSASRFPTISSDGRYVAFMSNAANLVSGDTNGKWDVFVRDRQTAQTARISVSSGGAQGDGDSTLPAISAGGRYVTFASEATNLIDGDTTSQYQIFFHDRQTGQTTLVSVASDATPGYGSSNSRSSISDDGRYVAFASEAYNLVDDDTNGLWDIFVHDRQTVQTIRLSPGWDGSQSNSNSLYPCISADGRFVAFRSAASNLVVNDTNDWSDIFVRDRLAGRTVRVSVASDGTQGNFGVYWPDISAAGRYVAFNSYASTLVSGDTNSTGDVFVSDWFFIDLSPSSKSVSPSMAGAGEPVTFTITLRNAGPMDSVNTRLFDAVPVSTTYVPGSAQATSGSLTDVNGIHWTGDVVSGAPVVITFTVTLDQAIAIQNTAVITDALGVAFERSAWVNPRSYLPLVME